MLFGIGRVEIKVGLILSKHIWTVDWMDLCVLKFSQSPKVRLEVENACLKSDFPG
jgi:hypothetical protein